MPPRHATLDGMRPSMNPIRFQYRTPEGEVKWSEPYPCIHTARVRGWELVAAGNVIEGTFRDYVGNPLIGPFPAQYPMPRQAIFLGGRRVC